MEKTNSTDKSVNNNLREEIARIIKINPDYRDHDPEPLQELVSDILNAFRQRVGECLGKEEEINEQPSGCNCGGDSEGMRKEAENLKRAEIKKNIEEIFN